MLVVGVLVLALTIAVPAIGRSAAEPDPDDTRMVSQPAISATHIAFAYAGDLWSANRDGTGVRRLTTHPGAEMRPRFSPDGRWLASWGCERPRLNERYQLHWEW